MVTIEPGSAGISTPNTIRNQEDFFLGEKIYTYNTVSRCPRDSISVSLTLIIEGDKTRRSSEKEAFNDTCSY